MTSLRNCWFYLSKTGKIQHSLQSILITAVSVFFIPSVWDVSSWVNTNGKKLCCYLTLCS